MTRSGNTSQTATPINAAEPIASSPTGIVSATATPGRIGAGERPDESEVQPPPRTTVRRFLSLLEPARARSTAGRVNAVGRRADRQPRPGAQEGRPR
jgi:hypothetical protein